ncbi:hypothetical protein BGZ65_007338 [Modicella reniformis]|uniref:BAR-domain-containing protein n=1 Tax=Modicella reniformis TaxID=1440133 RepID=A0A9P6MFV0_9FUNG|nr:hypothetical protein BGZ65_007338 [Modicella reniformis]
MIKNIGKLKQWTGEKMGKAPKTRMDEDFNALQAETEAKRVTLDKLDCTSQAYLKAISKRIEGEDKQKSLAIETFGSSMSSQGHVLREGSIYREALLQMGEAHQNIGVAQSELISRFGTSYLDCLEKEQTQMKEYLALQKKLNSRRLDYDAKLAKVQKAKKEKPEWEEEMQAAKAKYDNTRESLLEIMTAMNDSQDESVQSLKAYHVAQLTFARRMVEILEGIPESTFTTSSTNGSRSSPKSMQPCRISRHSSDEDNSANSDDRSSVLSASTTIRNQLHRTSTASDLCSAAHVAHNTTTHARKGSVVLKTNGYAPPPPVLPTRRKQQKQVRALYNFEATGEGELSLQKGDVVRIIDEIDEGWWEGELVDSKGVRHEGMFPSNYVEEVNKRNTISARRQGSVSSNTSDSRYVDEDEAVYLLNRIPSLSRPPWQSVLHLLVTDSRKCL